MAQVNNNDLNWQNAEWRRRFFANFNQELPLCHWNNLEHNLQNTERYNSTRQRCQFVFNYYLTRVECIVTEMESTETPLEIVGSLRNYLHDIRRNPIFEGIVDQTTERVIHEDFDGVHQVNNPMLTGNNQEWSELSIVNHYNRLNDCYMRVLQYINDHHEGGRAKYRKYRKATKKATKSRKATKTKKSTKSRKSTKSTKTRKSTKPK